MPHCEPSPNNSWNRGRSVGGEMMRMSLMPASMRVLTGWYTIGLS